MATVVLGHRAVHVEDSGVGRALLLLHGFPLSSDSFWPQLEAPPAGWRVVAPDHRGFGQSPPADGVSTMEALADDAAFVLDALGIERAVVGGVSMGGYVALALAKAHPDRVEGLVLIDTRHTPDDAAGRAGREATAAAVERDGVDGVVAAMLPKLLAPTASADVRARVERIMQHASAQGTASALRGMATRVDQAEVLTQFTRPVLVVVGDGDVITPPDSARAMAALNSRARLAVLAGAGHLSNVEQPQAFAAALSEFLAGVP